MEEPQAYPGIPGADYSLTVEEVGQTLTEAGYPRDESTIRRWCRNSTLDCALRDRTNTDAWVITKESIEKRIKQLSQVHPGIPRHIQVQPGIPEHAPSDVKRITELEKENQGL